MADPSQSDPLSPVPGRGRRSRTRLLPTPLSSFVGREHETRQLIALLQRPDGRLLTLTGPGGVGKTRLAVHVAEALTDVLDDLVFVSLASVQAPELVMPAIAQVLGIREAGDRPLVARIAAGLQDRSVLFVLDNLERALPGAAPQVAELLGAGAGIRVLATSREALRLSGEWVVTVRPLALPGVEIAASATEIMATDAVRLFVSRAEAARSDFVLTDADAGTIAEICRRLDGLPLALELAAARITLLPPSAMLARMERRLPLLTDGARDHPARLRTMRDAINWSHDLLAHDARVLFRRLAVFNGGFTLEGAEAVSATADTANNDVLAGIGDLVNQSLLGLAEPSNGADGDSPRYRMLETIREFGLEHLEASGEAVEIRRCHAAWCLAFAEEWSDDGSVAATALNRLERELANVRTALAWAEETGEAGVGLRLASALIPLWHYRNHRAEGRRWLEGALARDTGPPSGERAAALVGLGLLEHNLGDAASGAIHLAEGLALAHALGDRRLVARASFNLANIAVSVGDDDRAVDLLMEAEARCEEVGDLAGIAHLCIFRGLLAHRQGRLAEAIAHFADALTRADHIGNAYIAAIARELQGFALCDRGDYGQAAAGFRASLATWQELGTKEGLVDWLALVASLAAAAGESKRATRLFGAVEARAEVVGFAFPRPEQARFRRIASDVRLASGDAVFGAAWAAGRTLTPEQAVDDAERWLATLATAADSGGPEDPAAKIGLTPRERDVLRLLVGGRSDRDIAAALFISHRTVNSHIAHILAKLGVGSRTEAATAAMRQHLI